MCMFVRQDALYISYNFNYNFDVAVQCKINMKMNCLYVFILCRRRGRFNRFPHNMALVYE